MYRTSDEVLKELFTEKEIAEITADAIKLAEDGKMEGADLIESLRAKMSPESEQRFSLLELLPPNNSLRILSNEELLAYLPVTILPRTIDDTEAANVAATVLNQVIREEILRRLQQERLTISPQN